MMAAHTYTMRWHLGHGQAACACVSRQPAQLAQHVRVGKGMVGRVFFFSTHASRLTPRYRSTSRSYRVLVQVRGNHDAASQSENFGVV